MSSAVHALAALQGWRTAGHLRALDLAFARFLHELAPDAPASLLLAATLTAQMEGRGHSCLDLQQLQREPDTLLGWPAPVIAELKTWLNEDAARPQAWRGCALIEIDPADARGATPLVCSGARLYLRRYWGYESRVAAQVLARTASGTALPDARDVRRELDRLFARAPVPKTKGAKPAPEVIDWQKIACALALRGRLTLITGGPGTGKTWTAARLLVLLQRLHRGPQPLRVALAAPTGKAAARLRQSIDAALQGLRDAAPQGDLFEAAADSEIVASPGPARTLHALLGARPGTRRLRHDASHPLEVDLLFIDEASMVHLEMMAALLDALPPQAHLVLLGDKDQLASVEAGAVMGDLCQGADAGRYRGDTLAWIQQVTGQMLPVAFAGDGPPLAQHTTMLRHSHRFDGPIGELATAVNGGDTQALAGLLGSDADAVVAHVATPQASAVLPLAVQGRGAIAAGYRNYLQTLADRPPEAAAFEGWAREVLRGFDRCRVLCVLREGPWGVSGLNAAIEQALADAGLLKPGRGEWYEGRPVMVTRNDAALGVYNGDIGIVLAPPRSGSGTPPGLRAYFLDGNDLRSVSIARLAEVDTAFALTVHKSQGSEFEHVVLVLPDEDTPVLTRELVYTAITRAKKAFTLAGRHRALLDAAVVRLTRRGSGLRALLERGG